MKTDLLTEVIIDTDVRNKWFENLLIRQLVSTEEFFHIWTDYKCTCPQGFADVCEDVWKNGWNETDRNTFYLKYRDIFVNEQNAFGI